MSNYWMRHKYSSQTHISFCDWKLNETAGWLHIIQDIKWTGKLLYSKFNTIENTSYCYFYIFYFLSKTFPVILLVCFESFITNLIIKHIYIYIYMYTTYIIALSATFRPPIWIFRTRYGILWPYGCPCFFPCVNTPHSDMLCNAV